MKIRTKLAIFYLLSTLLIASFFAATMYRTSLNSINRIADGQMSRDIAILEDVLKKGGGAASGVEKNLMQRYWLLIVDKSGNTVFESGLAKTLPIPISKLANGHTLTVYTEFVNFTGNKDVILRIKKLENGDGASIVMGYPMDEDIAYSYQKTIAVFIAALILISVFAYFLLRLILKPLGEISDVLSEINELRLDVRLKKYSNDEIGLLAENINGLLEKLDESFANQRSFLSLMSHELKTPLSIIRTHIEQALMDDGVPMPLKRKFSRDVGQISRLDKFISRLLLLTRLEENSVLADVKRFNLSEMVDEISYFLMDVAMSDDKGLSLDIEPDIFIESDRVLLHRAIANLCENAVKFTLTKKNIRISLKRDNGKAVLTIADEAGGIDRNILRRAENRLPMVGYLKEGKTRNGIGLRLAIMLLKVCGLKYAIDSQEGEGTVFSIMFNVAETDKDIETKLK